MGLSEKQLNELVAVFRAEAIEHVKSLASVFFSLEDGTGDPGELITQAFRDAHSLKGSAATIGFERVAVITHRLEDVLGEIVRGNHVVSGEVSDLMLTAIDIIRQTVEESAPGDAVLSDKEEELIGILGKLITNLCGYSGPPEPFQSQDKKPVGDQPPPEDKEMSLKEKAPAPKENQTAPKKGKSEAATKDSEFVRISQGNIETVIDQVGELFEASLQIRAVVPELRHLAHNAGAVTQVLDNVAGVEMQTGGGKELTSLVDKSRGLSIQLTAVVNRLDESERQLSKLIQNSQEGLRKIRLAPVSTIFVLIRRQVREISKKTGKKVELFLKGGEYEVDRKVLESIEAPLVHILRNAIDHGLESAEVRTKAGKKEAGQISIVARHTGDAVELVVTDDGGGINPEVVRQTLINKRGKTVEEVDSLSNDQLFDYLFESGFSTSQGVSDLSGRGVGLDAVKHAIERVGGEVRLNSRHMEGTSISLRLPLAMSTLRCLLVEVAGRVLAIPAANVEKVIIQKVEEANSLGGGNVLVYKDQNIPLGTLAGLLGLNESVSTLAEDATQMVIMVRFGQRRFAFIVDGLVEYTQVILKPLGDLLERVRHISGISLLGTGEVALVLNPADLVRAAGTVKLKSTQDDFVAASETRDEVRVLVVDDSIATRTMEKALLESAGFTVFTASDGYRALDVLEANLCDIVISDVQMPNMDGIELTSTLKSRYRFSHIPVVLVTSLGSDKDKARGLEAGADAYIVKKDLTQEELVETIQQLL
jgi:two-component system, chemotaxis family, sensor kinase CheA